MELVVVVGLPKTAALEAAGAVPVIVSPLTIELFLMPK